MAPWHMEQKYEPRTKADNNKIMVAQIRYEISGENLKINTMEGKLRNKRMRLYGHILRTNEERIPKNVLNMK